MDVKKLGPKFESFKHRLEIINNLLLKHQTIEKIKIQQKVIDKSIKQINVEVKPLDNYPEILKNKKKREKAIKDILDKIDKQLEIDRYQNKEIPVLVEDMLHRLIEIQHKESISENMLEDISKLLDKLSNKQNQINDQNSKNVEEIDELEKKLNNSLEEIDKLREKIQQLQSENSPVIKDHQKNDLNEHLDRIEEIKKNIDNLPSEDQLEQKQQNLVDLQKSQLNHIDQLKNIENGVDEVESKKREDLKDFVSDLDDARADSMTQKYYDQFQTLAHSMIQAEYE